MALDAKNEKMIQGPFFRAQLFSLWFPIAVEILVDIYSHWGYINNGTSVRYVSVEWVFMRYLLLFIDPPWLTCTPVHVRKKQSRGAVHLSRGNCAQGCTECCQRKQISLFQIKKSVFELKRDVWTTAAQHLTGNHYTQADILLTSIDYTACQSVHTFTIIHTNTQLTTHFHFTAHPCDTL